ncbi:MAG: hypothetical protein ACXABZ_11675 [Candidatus Thorarchaeota archaeon]|jgi:hypothetical protein
MAIRNIRHVPRVTRGSSCRAISKQSENDELGNELDFKKLTREELLAFFELVNSSNGEIRAKAYKTLSRLKAKRGKMKQ